jgi:type I restriction enzyme M protein
MADFKAKASLIWEVANLLRGDYKQSDYGKVILPLTVLRRLDCVLRPTKEDVLAHLPKVADKPDKTKDLILNQKSGHNFHNRSKYDFDKLIAEPDNIASNLRNYINGFSSSAREIIEYFNFDDQIERMDDPKADILFRVVKKFSEIDLSDMDSMEMGYTFEELIRKFAEQSNETAGEHFTPREVIKLMVNLLFIADNESLTKEGIVKTMYDPACGTGGMLSVGEQHLKSFNPKAKLEVFGQEINPESYAICKSDMLIKGQNPSNVKFGNTFTVDGLEDEKFDYILSNPPFGVDWKKAQKIIKDEYDNKGFSGRFGAGLPRINDGSLLFLQHMISKMKSDGTRIAIVFNGTPLFSGQAESGESNIRQWIIENDWLEAIIGMPDQLFYNTGISTYIWIVSNKKSKERKGKIQLINANGEIDEELISEDKREFNRFWDIQKPSLGKKRKKIIENGEEKGIGFITKIYGDFEENEFSKIYPNDFFGYWRATIEQPQIEKGEIVTNSKGIPKPDTQKRDYENIPFLKLGSDKVLSSQTITEYYEREVSPNLMNSWVDEKKIKIGYEINFRKIFNNYVTHKELGKLKDTILEKDNNLSIILKDIFDIIENPLEYNSYVNIENNWIKKIPENWEFTKFKYKLNYTSGFTPPTKEEKYYQGDIDWITISDMNSKYVESSATKLTDLAIEDYKPEKTLKNSLLFSFKLSVGKVAFANKNLYTNEAIISIKPSENIDLRFFYYSLPEQLLNNANENIYGAKILNQETIKNAYITFPPLAEQKEIADFLDEKIDIIENAFSRNEFIYGKSVKDSGILHKLKQAFIHSVVTGKIKVN